MISKKNIPNLLTMLRLVLAAVFFALLAYYRFDAERYVLLLPAIVLFIAAALTDALDGSHAAVRERVGPHVTVGCRMLADEVIEGGTSVEEAAWFARRFAEAGMDFISISKGGKFEDARQPRVGAAAYPYTGESGHECMPTVRIDAPGPFGRNLPLSAAVRRAVREVSDAIPVVGCGGIGTFHEAEAALVNGDCDVVAAARQSLADPDWWRKVFLGRGEAVRRCIYTNYCEGLDQKHKEVTCQLWDRPAPGGPEHGEGGAPPHRGALRSADGKRQLLAPSWKE